MQLRRIDAGKSRFGRREKRDVRSSRVPANDVVGDLESSDVDRDDQRTIPTATIPAAVAECNLQLTGDNPYRVLGVMRFDRNNKSSPHGVLTSKAEMPPNQHLFVDGCPSDTSTPKRTRHR